MEDEAYKRTILDSHSALLKTSQSLMRSQQVALEAEEIGSTIAEDLGSQRETLLRARDRLVNTDYELSRSHQLLRLVKRNVFANKLFLIMIIILEVCILIGIVYIKFLR